MIRRSEYGRSGILLGVVLLGIIIVIGAMILFSSRGDDTDVGDLKTDTDYQDPEIVNTIADPELAKENVSEREEEKPTVFRTVNERGSTLYISSEKVELRRPGKENVKAYKIASPTNRKMKPNPKVPSRDKATPHPAFSRKKGDKGKAPDEMNEKGGDDDDSNDSQGGQGNQGGGTGQK
ncbi:MAG: hypothetical protein ACYTG7_19345 [Planctomycetota bacterium]|jgi:hypothetical protein